MARGQEGRFGQGSNPKQGGGGQDPQRRPNPAQPGGPSRERQDQERERQKRMKNDEEEEES
jgi:hypothetical protein